MLRRLRNDEGGWSLIEVLVGLVLSLLVCSLALDLIPNADSSARGSMSREAETVQAQSAVALMTREARAASAAAIQMPAVLDLTIPVRNAAAVQHVRYDCSTGTCLRYVCQNVVAGSLVGVPCTAPSAQSQIIDGLTSTNVFAGVLGAGAPQSTAVGIAPGTPAGMDHLTINLSLTVSGSPVPLEIEDGTAFANFSL